MSKRPFAIVLAALTLSGFIASASERPNILFLLADDVSYRNVSCYPGSYSWTSTPNIDALARQGVRFDRGYAGAWCMPSRATLMTGHQQYGCKTLKLKVLKYPKAIYDKGKMPLWPTALRENGYFTGMIGKWHIGVDTGWPRAWDYQKVWNRCRNPKNAHAYYDAQLIETNGGEAELVEGYPADFYTDWGIDFINGKGRDTEKPWFLWLCFPTAHGPFTPPERNEDLFPSLNVAAPADVYPPRKDKPTYMQKINKWTKGSDGRPKLEMFHTPKGSTKPMYGPDISDWNRQYQQTISAFDQNVGRLLKALEASGQLKNTLVVLTADQGFAFGQHGFATKMAPYDANIRPPLIFSQPGRIPSGSACKHPVTGPDIVSTLLAQTETEEPWFMHGHDFSPLLRNPSRKEWDHGALLALTGIEWGDRTKHLPLFLKHTQGIPWWVSYSKGKYKYIRTLEHNEIEELYDLENDPEEQTNLALKPEYHDLIEEFRQTAVAELKRTEAPFADKLPPVFHLDETVAERTHKMGSHYRKQKAAGRPFILRHLKEFFTHTRPPKELD